jgi:cytochrome c oxidase assembly protein subunit 15
MPARQRWTHRVALAVVVVALLPIGMGALTTTLGAGMAFLDWPTSDGRNMLLYDMLRDVRLGHTDKIAEHGHRLAGVVIGLFSIAFAALGWFDGRKGVRALAAGVLLCVIAQGVLGGARVLLDARTLAMLHSLFGAIVFALMGLAAAVTSKHWPALAEAEGRPCGGLTTLALLLPAVVLVQYVAGGFVRHFGTAIPEHLGGATVVALLALSTAMLALQTGIKPLRPFAWWLFAAVFFQVLLGFGAWAGRFGLAALGVVAVERSPLQVLLRSLHTVGGMALLMAAVLLAAAVLRLRRSEAASPNFAARTEPAVTLDRQPRGAALAGGAR